MATIEEQIAQLELFAGISRQVPRPVAERCLRRAAGKSRASDGPGKEDEAIHTGRPNPDGRGSDHAYTLSSPSVGKTWGEKYPVSVIGDWFLKDVVIEPH